MPERERIVACAICGAIHPDSLSTMRPLKRRHKRDRYVRPVCPACEEMGWQDAVHTFTRQDKPDG